MQTVKFGKKSVSIYYKDPKLMKLDDYASLKLFAKENPGADLEEARKALEEFSKARALEKAKDQTSAVDSKKKEATKKAPAKPVLKGISIKEPIHSTQSNRPITRSRTAETLDKGKGKVVVEKEVPKKTLVTIADSTKAEFLFEDNEQEATQLTRKRRATADPIPDAQVQEKASEFIPKPLPAGVTGFVSGVTSQASEVEKCKTNSEKSKPLQKLHSIGLSTIGLSKLEFFCLSFRSLSTYFTTPLAIYLSVTLSTLEVHSSR